MARKIKYKPKYNQPGLFDLAGDTGDVDTASPAPLPADDETPTAAGSEFDVRSVAPAKEAAAPSDPIELDASAIGRRDDIVFMSFGSGSSGNCSYIGDSEGGFLIDAGIDPDKLRDDLRANGLSFDNIKGVCLTHDHSDHVRFVYTLVRKHLHIGVYCTPRTLSGIMRRHSISRRLKDYHRPIYKEFAFKIGNFEITAFEVSHDGTDNSGFFITHGAHTFAVATDLGCITDRVEYYMSQARYIMLESNYDAAMLREGAYPMHLKARIAADNGHLDNAVAGEFLGRMLSPRLSHIFLCHLSKDNNTPETALATVTAALHAAGATSIGDCSGSLEARKCDVQLMALPRFDASPLICLRLT